MVIQVRLLNTTFIFCQCIFLLLKGVFSPPPIVYNIAKRLEAYKERLWYMYLSLYFVDEFAATVYKRKVKQSAEIFLCTV